MKQERMDSEVLRIIIEVLKAQNKDDDGDNFSATNKTSMRNLGATLLADASSMEL